MGKSKAGDNVHLTKGDVRQRRVWEEESLFDLSSEFEKLGFAYEEYGMMLGELGESDFDKGSIISILNEKFEQLTKKLYSFGGDVTAISV